MIFHPFVDSVRDQLKTWPVLNHPTALKQAGRLRSGPDGFKAVRTALKRADGFKMVPNIHDCTCAVIADCLWGHMNETASYNTKSIMLLLFSVLPTLGTRSCKSQNKRMRTLVHTTMLCCSPAVLDNTLIRAVARSSELCVNCIFVATIIDAVLYVFDLIEKL